MRDHTPLSPCDIPVTMQATYGPYQYHYTCYFAHYPGFSGDYAFVDPEAGSTMSLMVILTDQRVYNDEAIQYLRIHHPDLLL